MSTEPEIPAPDYEEIAQRIEKGDYFEDAKNIYASLYVDPISERYLYVFITFVSVVIFLVMVIAINLLLPLSTPAPFPFISADAINDHPVIKPLFRKEDTPYLALKRYLVTEYVSRRESYDIDQLELNVRFLKNHSNETVFDTVQKELDPSNPESPIAQYQRHAKRTITIINSQLLPDSRFEITYDARVFDTLGPSRRTRMMATVAFQFKDVTVDQETGKATPIEFHVTDYFTRRVQE